MESLGEDSPGKQREADWWELFVESPGEDSPGKQREADWWELFVESPGEDSHGKQRETDSRGLVGAVCGVPWGRLPWETEGGG